MTTRGGKMTLAMILLSFGICLNILLLLTFGLLTTERGLIILSLALGLFIGGVGVGRSSILRTCLISTYTTQLRGDYDSTPTACRLSATYSGTEIRLPLSCLSGSKLPEATRSR